VRQGGRPVRGFFAGLFLGLFLSIDLALLGAVTVDSAVLTTLPVALAILGTLLGWWSPIGRKTKPVVARTAPLPAPVAWPEMAPTEGSTSPTPSRMEQFPIPPPPVDPPSPDPPQPI
jgi:hypothetical protein